MIKYLEWRVQSRKTLVSEEKDGCVCVLSGSRTGREVNETAMGHKKREKVDSVFREKQENNVQSWKALASEEKRASVSIKKEQGQGWEIEEGNCNGFC